MVKNEYENSLNAPNSSKSLPNCSNTSQNVPKCLKTSLNVQFRRIVVRTDLILQCFKHFLLNHCNFVTVWSKKWKMFCRSCTFISLEMVYDVPNVLAAIHLCKETAWVDTKRGCRLLAWDWWGRHNSSLNCTYLHEPELMHNGSSMKSIRGEINQGGNTEERKCVLSQWRTEQRLIGKVH